MKVFLSKIVTWYYRIFGRVRDSRVLKGVTYNERFAPNFFRRRWKNGWYVNNGGNDGRKLYSFNKKNVVVDHDKIILVSKLDASVPVGILYSGVMVYSKRTYNKGVFRIKIDMNNYVEGNEFAVWLKDYNDDVNEIDIIEIFDSKHLVFTAHCGSNYDFDHKIHATTVNYDVFKKPHITIDLAWEDNKLVWMLNRKIVKVFYGSFDFNAGIIINYGKIDFRTTRTSNVIVREIKRAKKWQ